MSNLDKRIADLPPSVYSLISQIDKLNLQLKRKQGPNGLPAFVPVEDTLPMEDVLLSEEESFHDNG